MTADEIISKAEHFASNFVMKLEDSSETQQTKQIFFMENQEELRKYMGALQKTIDALRATKVNEDTDDVENDDIDNLILITKAEDIINSLKQAISNFQKELTIDADVQENDVTPVLSEETIGDAMKTNKTTQNIAANMEAISKQKETMALPYNYMLVCDDVSTMISANNKTSLESNINAVVDAGNYKDIKLYKIQYTPVALKTRTILSV